MAGYDNTHAALSRLLEFYLGGLEKQKDRAERQKERDQENKFRQASLDLEKRRADAADRAQRTSEAGVARSQMQPGPVDDPEMVARIQALFKDTPYEATIQNKTTLPSTGFGDAAGQGSQGGSPFLNIMPTSQEQRDALLMKMEQTREARESAEAPLREQILRNQGVTSSPEYLTKRLKEQHQFDLEDIQARIRAMYQTGKKTSFDDDMRTFINGMRSMDSIMDPNDRQVAQTALMGFLTALKSKYPQLQGAPKNDFTGDDDSTPKGVGDLPDAPGAAAGPGMMSRFLSGVGDFFSFKKCPNGAFPVDGKCQG